MVVLLLGRRRLAGFTSFIVAPRQGSACARGHRVGGCLAWRYSIPPAHRRAADWGRFRILSISVAAGGYNLANLGGAMKILVHLSRVLMASIVLLTAASAIAQQTPRTTASWDLKTERTVNGPEADLLVRTGDINNLGF